MGFDLERNGESIAIFRDGDHVSAIANRCAHQGGPLGEGQIIDGCVTCPWHGYQYRACDGQSPPPYTEKIPTHRVRITKGRVEIDAKALPPGTAVEPARISQEQEGAAS
jgi:nitrite reductase/ring-hydroxylating ferredoxin subunit